jgi:hypothetical protein
MRPLPMEACGKSQRQIKKIGKIEPIRSSQPTMDHLISKAIMLGWTRSAGL